MDLYRKWTTLGYSPFNSRIAGMIVHQRIALMSKDQLEMLIADLSAYHRGQREWR